MTTFLAPEAAPFLIATLMLLAIAAVEGFGLLIGMSASHWLDSLLHHSHVDGAHVDGVHTGVFASTLGWLHVGKVPVLALIVMFLASFAIVGFLVNMVLHGLFGFYLPALVGAPVAFVAALPVVRFTGRALMRVMPKDETSAVSLDSLVGRMATVVSGTARLGFPAQAKVMTESGQPIYVMLEPDSAEVTFATGEEALLVKRLGGTKFQGIRNPKPDLL
ncbi:MAG: YqiJ family protein [Solimonas sp.]